MLKILTYLLAFYLAYRYFIKPALLPASEEQDSRPKVKKQPEDPKPGNEDEYIDYEEVE